MAPDNTKKDHWSSEAYQHSASFVPKLAGKIMQWLDPQEDDVILDIGCGDGVLSLQAAAVLARGTGRLHGVDASAAMIEAAEKASQAVGLTNCKFEVCDANELAHLAGGVFTKAFSNAAMHWILRPSATREQFFRGVREAVAPGGVFVFEMGGLGNVSEVVAAVAGPMARRVGLARARELSPWFFPDEAWVRRTMEEAVGGWAVERAEREWRPTDADAGGVDGWVRLMAARFFDDIADAAEREACIREVVELLEFVCAKPGGGHVFNYVRLRVVARRL